MASAPAASVTKKADAYEAIYDPHPLTKEEEMLILKPFARAFYRAARVQQEATREVIEALPCDGLALTGGRSVEWRPTSTIVWAAHRTRAWRAKLHIRLHMQVVSARRVALAARPAQPRLVVDSFYAVAFTIIVDVPDLNHLHQ